MNRRGLNDDARSASLRQDSEPAEQPRQKWLEPLLLGLSPIQPAPEQGAALKARILARARGEPQQPFVHFEDTFTIRADCGEWIPVAPGVQLKRLRRDGDARTYLLRLHPGAVFPAHQHGGDEECLVLEGEVTLGELRVVAGDYHFAPRGSTHRELRSSTGALLFLRSAQDIAFPA